MTAERERRLLRLLLAWWARHGFPSRYGEGPTRPDVDALPPGQKPPRYPKPPPGLDPYR